VETIGSKRSYALIWCMPNNDDDVVYVISMWHLRENNGMGLIQFSNHSNVIITSWPGFGDVYTDISCCYAPDGAVL